MKEEYTLRRDVVQYCQVRGLITIPNIVEMVIRGPRDWNKVKSQGYLKGCPDLFIAKANAKYHGLFFEFKSKGKHASSEQTLITHQLNELGYLAVIADDLAQCIEIINSYLM